MPLFSNVTITGDCLNSNSGAVTISVTPYNDTGTGTNLPTNKIYAIEWTDPYLGVDYDTLTSSRQNLNSGFYSVRLRRVYENITGENEDLVIYVSSGFCTNVYSIESTSCGFNNGSISLSATSDVGYPFTFNLYNSNDELINTLNGDPNNVFFDSLSGDSYYLITTDNGGCTAITENIIIENSAPFNFDFYTINNSNCNIVPTGKLIITGQTGTPPYTYLWGDGQTGSTITGLTNGGYSVTVTDAEGCSLLKTAAIVSVSAFTITSSETTQPTCFGSNGQVLINMSGGTTPYYYSSSTGNIGITYSDSILFTGLTSGQFSVMFKDAGYCEQFFSTLLQTPDSIYQLNIQSTNSSCSQTDGSITVTLLGGSPPYSYTLIYPDGNVFTETTNQTAYLFGNLSGGTYTVAIQDQTTCGKTQEIFIITENKYTIETFVTGSTVFNNGSLKVSIYSGGTPPFVVSLDNKNKITTSNIGDVYFYNLSPGQHEVSVVDFTGCIQKNSFFVTTIPSVDFFFTSKPPGLGNQAEITALITNGTPPYQFYWSENVTNNPQEIKITGLTAGTYTLTVVDSNKSTKTRTIEIPKTNKISTYSTFGVGSKKVSLNTESKYDMLRMLNEGYQDVITGNTNCALSSANFVAKVVVLPMDIETTQLFYTSNSLLDSPTDNLWYDTAKNLLLTVQGVRSVDINELTNVFTIEADLTNPDLIYGDNPIIISLSLLIDYNINCES